MTPGRHEADQAVDLDLLADFAGGALDGTPDHARVAALVESEPTWAEALRELRTAESLVYADLAALSRTPEPVPDDVARRLEAVLADARPDPARARVVPLDRRRRYRVAAAAAVAAAAVGIAGYAGYAVLGGGGPADTPAAVTGGAPHSAPEAARGDAGFQVPVSATGRDYTRESLAGSAGKRAELNADRAGGFVPPRELAHLASPSALASCLTAVRAAHPGAVDAVDFARFEGTPALIVSMRETGGANRVVVVGPGCEQGHPDEKYTATT